jgi:hypothetical protein
MIGQVKQIMVGLLPFHSGLFKTLQNYENEK